MAKRYHIDNAQLEAHKACEYEHENFKRAFPDGRMEINQDNVRHAMQHRLPLRWPASRLRDAANYVGDTKLARRASRIYGALCNHEDYPDDPRHVSACHRLMHRTAEEWELFKIAHPEVLPSSY